MEIPKPSEADKDFFRAVLPDDPAVEVKPMFGNLGAFVYGNMCAGLFGPGPPRQTGAIGHGRAVTRRAVTALTSV
jgi:hypothetical protein